MVRTPTHKQRGGVLPLVIASIGALAVGTVAAMSYSPAPHTAAAVAAKRPAEPREIASMLHMIDLNPEALAAAGLTGLDCDGVFDAAATFCIQADRIGQFELAYRNLNAAKAKAVHPIPGGLGNQIPTVAQAQTVLDDLKSATFQFVTTGLAPERIAKLRTIRSNGRLDIPAPYKVVDRTEREWVRLRGALHNKAWSDQNNQPLDDASSQIIATADGDQAVVQAKADLASNRASVQTSWAAHENGTP